MNIINIKNIKKENYDHVYACDGSSTRIVGTTKFFGGWSSVHWDKARNKISPYWNGNGDTTVNRMELTAFIAALHNIHSNNLSKDKILILLDSEYVLNSTTKYLQGWIRNNWMTANKQPVMNKDLWEELIFRLNLCNVNNISLGKVKAHTKDITMWSEMNNVADVYSRKFNRDDVESSKLLLEDLLILQ